MSPPSGPSIAVSRCMLRSARVSASSMASALFAAGLIREHTYASDDSSMPYAQGKQVTVYAYAVCTWQSALLRSRDATAVTL